jgi:YaiO family outer membrane protein
MRVFCLAAFMAVAPLAAQAADETPIAAARALAEAKRYNEALNVLRAAQSAAPGDLDIGLATARVLSWKGDYRAAEAHLDQLPASAQRNPETLTVRGNLAYYQSDLTQAKAIYSEALAMAPDFVEARDGLQRVDAALAAQGDAPKWQADIGGEHSGFSNSAQPDWNQQFVQATRLINGGKRVLHLRLTHYDQFGLADTEAELGASARLSDRLDLYGAVGAASNADFRPESRFVFGGSYRAHQTSWGGVWLTFDGRHDRYSSLTVNSAALGIRVANTNGWAVSSRRIRVDQGIGEAITGYDVRVDGKITDTLRAFAGFADAPETVAAVTIVTRSIFTGLAWDVTPKTTLRAGYSRDDRENVYVRQGINVTLSQRF